MHCLMSLTIALATASGLVAAASYPTAAPYPTAPSYSYSASAPYPANGTNLTTSTNSSTPTGEYYLVTQVIGNGSLDKNGLYVSGYHTGAGFNDVTLEGIDDASVGFFNDSYQQFDYNTSFPWGLQMGGDTNYAAWEFAMIDVGMGSQGFSFNGSGLQYNETYDGFGGWLACDWWHGVPQLFWLVTFYESTSTYKIPSSCALVNLLPQAL